MNDNTKLEVAVEILAKKIANTSLKGYKIDDLEMRKLMKEREEMYKGNEMVIDKIIRKYGPEIKENYESV